MQDSGCSGVVGMGNLEVVRKDFLCKRGRKRYIKPAAASVSPGLCSEFSVNARFHDKTVHILRSSEPEAEAEPPPMAARSVLDRLA